MIRVFKLCQIIMFLVMSLLAVEALGKEKSEDFEIVHALAELDSVIKEKNPLLYAKLGSPAAEQELQRLNNILKKPNPYLSAWYSWRNQSQNEGAFLLPLGMLMSVEELGETKKLNSFNFLKTSLERRSIQFLADGAGDGYYIDLHSSDGQVFYVMGEDPHPIHCGNFKNFIAFLIKVQSSRTPGMKDADLDYEVFEAIQREFCRE